MNDHICIDRNNNYIRLLTYSIILIAPIAQTNLPPLVDIENKL